jgi:putative phosphoesterase
MKIGVIADTHGLLDPKVPEFFADVDHILHGGDVGTPAVLAALESLAPTTAVLGNVDVGFALKETEVVELAGRRFLLHHIVNPHALEPSLQDRVRRAKPAVVVFGHTHKPFCEQIGDLLFLNPGSAGRARFNLPRCLVILHAEGKALRVEYKSLE